MAQAPSRTSVRTGSAPAAASGRIERFTLAGATLQAPHFAVGTTVDFELTVDAVRHRVPATVVATPFFNPPRKTAVPALTPRP